MSQSTKIAAILIFLFIVYVTVKGQLPAYLSVLGLKAS